MEFRILALLAATVMPTAEHLKSRYYPETFMLNKFTIALTIFSFIFFLLSFKAHKHAFLFTVTAFLLNISFFIWGLLLNIATDFSTINLYALVMIIVATIMIIYNIKYLIAYCFINLLITFIACIATNIPLEKTLFATICVLNVDALVGYLAFSRLKLKQQLHDSLEVKDTLMREIHHRIKNNLQMISSMLTLQMGKFNDHPDYKKSMLETQERIQTISLVHEHIYQNNNISTIHVKPFFEELISRISKINGKQSANIQLKCDDFQLDTEQVLLLGVYLNEVLTNIFKHSSLNLKKANISVTFVKEKDKYQLKIIDPDTTFDTKKIDNPGRSFGLSLIKTLSAQLNGNLSVDNKCGQDKTKWILCFKP